jgi:two-component system response regulator PilR (NtrC family)
MARVLIVDDEDELREMLAETVRSLGHEVFTAEDGEKGLHVYKQQEIDLVITDLKMPRMDGLTLLREIRLVKPDAVVLMITAFPTIDSAVQAIKLGAYDYIIKPFKIEQIEVVVRRAVEKKRLMEQLGLFRGMFWLALFSIPFWIILGVVWFSYIKGG